MNILTHLECKRVKNLMKQGKSFSNAKELAEKGKITDNLLKEEIVYGSMNVSALSVMENVEKYYKSQGTEVVVNNIRKYIDGNGDGVLDERDETIDDGTVIIPPIEQDDEEVLVQLANEDVSKYFQLITVLDAVRCNQASIADIQINPNNVLLTDAWSRVYAAMSDIHQLIGRDFSDFSFDAKPYIGSLRLLRSLVYLDMVQHWDGVPLVTGILDPSDASMPRNSKADILAFVISFSPLKK